ncbi:MAG: C_GCAxxG_C_C family protein [Clostridiales bacterium]|nr:C_GCAxxG_C_C family protein [Clostridiales bacterium]
MSDTLKQIMRLSAQGLCCSQILVTMALDANEDENPQLVDAVRGLCKGLGGGGYTCGVLLGAVCVLSMMDPRIAEAELIPRLTEWFEVTFNEQYGGTACAQILGDDPMNKCERCPQIMALTYEKCRALLEEHGMRI